MKLLPLASAIALLVGTVGDPAYAQQATWNTQPGAQGSFNQPTMAGTPMPMMSPAPTTGSSSRKRGMMEMTVLYPLSAAYGVGMGVWFSTEVGLEPNDLAVYMIPPALLGVAAPIGVYALDRPSMPRGMPTAITAGMLLGAGEGIGIWSVQFVRTREDNSWGFTGLSRSVGIATTAGALGGFAAGYYLEPPPTTSVLALSGATWGSAIGTMFGFGVTTGPYREANDTTAIGGLIGYNVGALAAGGFGAVAVPSATQIGYMWGGAGVGAAISLPIFLAYAGEGGPPARRGFIFMGTATTLGILAGGVLGSDGVDIGRAEPSVPGEASRFGEIQAVLPVISREQVGISMLGTLN